MVRHAWRDYNIRVGERSVSIRTTGHDKGRFTVILAALADGRKLKPFVVFKGVRAIPELSHVPNVVVALSRNGWMNEALTVQWIDSVWGRLTFQCRLLVWDAYRCHTTDMVKDHIQRHTQSDTCLIPGGLTSQLQPADLSCNKPFKAAYRELYLTSQLQPADLSCNKLPIVSFTTHGWPQERSLSLQRAI